MNGTIVCDLDGVLFRGTRPVPGAGEALTELERLGYRLVFCTNNSYRTVEALRDRIGDVVGYQASPDRIVTSAHAAARLLEGEVSRAYVVGGEGIRQALSLVGVEVVPDWRHADAVVVGLDRDLTYDRLADATKAIRGGARFVATNHDPTWPGPDGLYPGAGAIVAALETATERRAEVAGKPNPPMRRVLAERMEKGPVWMVGDRPDTDLAMAAAEGWKAVLVLTGVTKNGRGVEPVPDLIIDSIADLPGRLSVRSTRSDGRGTVAG